MEAPPVLINPVVRWATEPQDATRIKYLDGHPGVTLPYVDQVITTSFLVDPVTQQPAPVRVVRIQTHWSGSHHTLVVVVTPHPPH
jgi:hypothetical protein